MSETPNLDKWLQGLPPEESGTPLLDYLEQCSNIANYSGESAGSPTQAPDIMPTKSKPLPTATLTNRRSPHTPDISQKSESIEISASISPKPENSISLPAGFHALGRVAQEAERDLITKSQDYGGKASESCAKSDPDISSGSNLWELSIEDLEQSLGDAEWQVIRRQVLRSPLQNLAPPTNGNEFLSLPTLTTGSGTTRNAGRTKLEDRLKRLGILKSGYQLSPEAMAVYMGFPWDLFEPITGLRLMSISGLLPTDSKGVMMPADWQAKPLPQDKRRSPSIGSSTKKGKGRPKGSTGKASGWLVATTQNRNGKTLPIVQGARVPKELALDYPHQFFWIYQWKEWCDRRESWVTKSKRINRTQLNLVNQWIQKRLTVNEILCNLRGYGHR